MSHLTVGHVNGIKIVTLQISQLRDIGIDGEVSKKLQSKQFAGWRSLYVRT